MAVRILLCADREGGRGVCIDDGFVVERLLPLGSYLRTPLCDNGLHDG